MKPINPQRVYRMLDNEDAEKFLELIECDGRVIRSDAKLGVPTGMIKLDPGDETGTFLFTTQEVWNDLLAQLWVA